MAAWDNKKAETAPASLAGWPAKANPGNTPAGAPATSASTPVDSANVAVPHAGPVVKRTVVDRDAYWANKEARDLEKEKVYREEDIPAIRRSVAYQAAATLAATALAHDVLSFGSIAKGKKLDMYLGFVDLIAAHVAERLTNGFDVVPGQEDLDDVVEGGSIEE